MTRGYVTGVHYVIVGSAPNAAAADEYVQRVNLLAESAGRNDLRASTYSSPAGTPWYSIVVGGPHYSLNSAEAKLAEAKSVLGSDVVDPGAWIGGFGDRVNDDYLRATEEEGA